MSLASFSGDVLDTLVETHKQICLPIKEDVTMCQYLVEKGLATYDPICDVIKLTGAGQGLYQKLQQTIKNELGI